MSLSLLATAAGGFYMATFPGFVGMAVLYGCWGVTTIFLFWAAMIRLAREWGGSTSQGLAFGVLDGGRGLVAAGFALLAVTALAMYLPLDGLQSSTDDRRQGLRSVILLYSAATATCGVLAWFLLPGVDSGAAPRQACAPPERGQLLRSMWVVLRQPLVWAQAAVIVCAYCAYKGLDNYSLYAVQVLGLGEVEAARLTAWASWLRPLAAVATGLAADRFRAGRVIAVAFAALAVSYVVLGLAAPSDGWLQVIYANVFVSFFAVFALRGVYFALLEETDTPRHLTGTTVGAVSFIGYTPEVFFGPLTGRILDRSPGLAGHQHYFLFLAACALLGLLVAAWLVRAHRRNGPPLPPATLIWVNVQSAGHPYIRLIEGLNDERQN
jgi:nitrate/nitrite transporter NarK